MKKLLAVCLLVSGLSAFALPVRDSKEQVKQFFRNYSLIGDWAAFQKEQAKLLSSYLVTVVSDHRGRRYFSGPEGYFASLGYWGQIFSTGDDFWVHLDSVTKSQVTARVRGTITMKLPSGTKQIRDDQHQWKEIFTFDRNGRIQRLDVRMNLPPNLK